MAQNHMQIRHTCSRTGLFLLTVVLLLSGCTRAQKEARFLSRADGYFKAGDYDEARIEYLNALRLNPKNAIAFQQLGIIWFDRGDVLQALQLLSKARELAPDNLEAHVKIGFAWLAFGDAAAAGREALAILKQAPDNGDAIVLLCNSVRTPDDGKAAAQQLQKFPNHDTVSFQLASASLSLWNGDSAGGEKAINQALTLDPNSPDAHLALAGVLLNKKDLPKAAQEFKTAADLSPPRGIARLRYAEFELQAGAVDQAKAILADIMTKTPDYVPAALLQARMAYSGKKFDDALAVVAGVLERDPGNLDAHIFQAQLWLAKGDIKSAIASLERLAGFYPNLPVVKYQLAQAYLQNGDDSKAVTVLSQDVAVNPDYTDAVLLLAGINLRTGNVPAVVPAMVKVLKRQPGLLPARFLLAGAYRALKQYDDANALFRQQIQMYPKDSQSYFMFGMTLLDQGDLAGARTAFEKAHELVPLDLVPTYQLVDLDIRAGDFAAALKRVQSQIQAQPKAPGAEFLLGKVYAAQKDWPNAEAALSKSLALDPNSADAYQLLTSVYLSQNKSDQAIVELQTFLGKSPTNADALMLLGDLYKASGQFPKAREAYEQLLSGTPDYAPALNNLALVRAQDPNDLDAALSLAQRARSLMPADPNVADTLGWILYKKGGYAQALTLFQESVSKPPVAQEILFHFGMANYMMGYPDPARMALQQALNGPADFAGKADIPARLAFLDKVQSGTATRDEIEAALKQEPADVYAQVALGDSWIRDEEWAKAGDSYQLALDRNPALISVTLSLADLNAGPLHDLDKAFALAEKARELAPTDPRAAGILGRVAYGKGDFLQAYNLLQEALTSATDDAKASSILLDFGWAAYSQGNIPEARGAMQRITKAAPPNSTVAKDAALFLSLTDPDQSPNDLAASEAQITKLLQTTPDYVPALMAQAQIRVKNSDTKGAEDDYTAVLRRFPDFLPAQRNLALLYSGDPAHQDTAYDLAVIAHKALPDDPEVSKALGAINYRRKEYAYAAQLLQESGEKQPLDTESLFYLGMSLWQTKDKPESGEALGKAVAAGLSGSELAQAKQVLAQLKTK